jgi:hypothetical protein
VTRLKDLFRLRSTLSSAQPSGAALTVPPTPCTVPQPHNKRSDLIVPEMPAHVKAALKQTLAVSTTSTTPLPQASERIRRINVPMLCAVKDAAFVLVFRQNRFSKKYFHESTILTVTGGGPTADVTSYDISELVGLDRVKCPHCRSKAGPISCRAGHFTCTGRVDESTNYFRCADSCGVHGVMTSGLRTITGCEHESVPRGPVTRSPGNSQARLSLPTSRRLLPGGKP